MISNQVKTKRIKTGTYTGNGADGRQIATGFKCSMAWVANLTTPFRGMIIPNVTVTDKNNADNTDDTAAHYVHATDGFVVSDTSTVNLNFNTEVYYYWAIEE